MNKTEAVAIFTAEADSEWVRTMRRLEGSGTAYWTADPEVPDVWGFVKTADNNTAYIVVYSSGEWECSNEFDDASIEA